ncbi:uncharacterized protein LOC124535406 [Vanessa cardui]|uniref:uncharacterized protein LOC124535406 n=1 Tax=Vanessa cardui TaxID=171605 RepID=UPI001F13A516|nr:uncharacterized protein LOC124535406 [Vanessa cardui]
MDAIFALLQLCEKYRRAHMNLLMVFIDLEKSNDRVPREVLLWPLNEKWDLVPTSDRLPVTPISSKWPGRFTPRVGSKSLPLPADYGYSNADIQEEASRCMLFADVIVLFGEDGPEIQSRLEDWQRKLENVGLKISRTKTEYMFR